MKASAQISYLSAAQLPKLVDRLGKLKAAQSDLAAEEKAIKATLEQSGLTAIEGKFFRVTVAQKSRQVLDSEKIAATLGTGFLAEFSRTSAWTEVRVVSR